MNVIRDTDENTGESESLGGGNVGKREGGVPVERLQRHNAAMRRLVLAVQELSLARNLETVMAIVRKAARELTGADGATFVLRDGDKCHYADEDAIAPLWKGQRFPMSACISGWAMLNRRPAVIQDIYADARIPADAYRPTFVKSLVMVPIRVEQPIGAIGNYWARSHLAAPEETEVLQALANTTAVAMENIQVYSELEARVRERTMQLEATHRELAFRTQEQLARQATLLDLATDAIFVRDMDGRIQYWNKGAERLHGWRAEEILGRRASDFLYEEGAWFPQALTSLTGRGEWSGEVPKKTKTGGEVLVQAHWTLMRDAADSPRAILSIGTDVTEQRRLEVQVQRTQRLESLGAMAAGIAHDLNNVFAPILMGVEMLGFEGQGLSCGGGDPLLGTIRGCALRGSEMVKQILTFARGTGGQTTRLMVEALIADVVQLVKATFPRSVRVEVDCGANLGMIVGNATQLHQVFMNLCVNARDAMPGGGVLRWVTSRVRLIDHVSRWEPAPVSGDYVMFTITDTGTGMPPEILNKIFVPFYTTKGQGKGTGLGLSSSLGIVKNHGGFVDVATQVGHGTTFKVCIPAVG